MISVLLPYLGESQLGEYFVCNHIGTSSTVFLNRVRETYIENATLPALQNFDRRGETRNIILNGACGYGKTLMLQHVFLEAADHVSDTGLLPLFAELKGKSELFHYGTHFRRSTSCIYYYFGG